jgi:hypothetical protein
MVVLLSTAVSRYHNCCINGGISPEYFGKTPYALYERSVQFIGNKVIYEVYTYVHVNLLHRKHAILNPNVISGFHRDGNEICSLLGFVEA